MRDKNFLANHEDLNKIPSGFAYLQMIFDNHDKPIDHIFLNINLAYEKLTGLKKEEIIGEKASKFINNVGQTYLNEFMHVLNSDSEQSFEAYFPITKKHVIISVVSLNDNNFATSLTDITHHKLLNNKLEEENKWLDSIVNYAPDIIYRLDSDGHIVFINKAIGNYGYKPEELVGKHIIEIVHPEDKDKAIYKMNERRTGQRSTKTFEVRLLTKENIPIHFEAKSIFIEKQPVFLINAEGLYEFEKSDDKRFIGTQGVARDITKRKQAEIALQETEERFRSIVENSHEGIFLLDETFCFSYYNNRLLEILDYPENKIIGKKLNKFLDPESKRLVSNDLIKNYREKESPLLCELNIVRKSGEKRRVEINVSRIEDSSGNIKIIGLMLDITKRKKAESALRESEEKYRFLIEHSNDAIYILHNRRFEYVNEKFEDMFGVSLEEVNRPKFDFLDLVADKSKPFLKDRIKRLSRGEELEPKYEFTALSKDGREIEVDTSVTYVTKKDWVATQGILRDVTDRKRLEEQLRQAQKMEAVGRLAGGVAHDFNNLLTVISGYCELLLSRKDKRDPLYNYTVQIADAAKKAESLTGQLLAFSRRQIMQPRVFDLNELIQELEKMLKRLIGEDIELKTIFDPELDAIKADPHQMEQVIMNIAVNARDAMLDGGEIIIETSNAQLTEEHEKKHGVKIIAGQYVKFSISDTGLGMDNETRNKIFEPFFTTKEKGKGTGLGLATVYGIIKQSNGFIWVNSEPGKGTKFEIYLPRADEEIIKSEKPKISNKNLFGNETILIIEDEHNVRNLVYEMLQSYGYNVLEASSGDKALHLCKKYKDKIHLILADVVMPQMSGRQIVERLSLNRPDTKVLYMSGYTDDAIVHHGILDEDKNFIQKPFSPKIIAQRIREVLDEGITLEEVSVGELNEK